MVRRVYLVHQDLQDLLVHLESVDHAVKTEVVVQPGDRDSLDYRESVDQEGSRVHLVFQVAQDQQARQALEACQDQPAKVVQGEKTVYLDQVVQVDQVVCAVLQENLDQEVLMVNLVHLVILDLPENVGNLESLEAQVKRVSEVLLDTQGCEGHAESRDHKDH